MQSKNPYRILCLLHCACVALLCGFGASHAVEKTQVTVRAASRHVGPGEAVVINIDIRSPRKLKQFPGLDIPSAPSFEVVNTSKDQSHQSSIQIINGKMSRNVTLQYMYRLILRPTKNESFTFPSCKVTVGDSIHTTKAIAITVENGEKGENGEAATALRTTVTISDRSPYTSEQVVVTLRIRQRADAGVDIPQQSYHSLVSSLMEAMKNDFSVMRITPSNEIGKGIPEDRDGVRSYVFTERFACFALHAGTVTIPSQIMKYYKRKRVSRQRRSRDPFDRFFDGFMGSSAVQRIPAVAKTNALQINVQQRPNPPQQFSGCVGELTLRSKISTTQLREGEEATVTVTVGAHTRAGNLPQISLPDIEDADIFEPEISTHIDTSSRGLYTTRNYKFLTVFNSPGTITIPAVKAVWFDPEENQYTYARTEPQKVKVEKSSDRKHAGEGSRLLTQTEIRQQAQDIRYIHTNVTVRPQSATPYRQLHFAILYALAILFALAAFLVKKNIHVYLLQLFMRSGQSYQYSQRMLKKTAGRISALSPAEVGRRCAAAVEHYISQRFGLHPGASTREQLGRALTERGVDPAAVEKTVTFLQHTDACRYGFVASQYTPQQDTTQKASRDTEGAHSLIDTASDVLRTLRAVKRRCS